jgi:hypothetical protein
MSLSSWFSRPLSQSQTLRGQRRNSASRRKKARPFLEHLEDRALLTNYTAATVSDLITDINLSNKAGGANTITLTAPTTSPYGLTAINNYTVYGANDLPIIAAKDDLTIIGNGDTIDRAHSGFSRLLDVAAGASLTLQNLTLKGGQLSFARGGAIFNQGALALSGVTLTGNQVRATGSAANVAMGGGIWSSGSLILENGTIVENNFIQAGSNSFTSYNAFGGGVYIAGGSANISNTTFTGNSGLGGVGDGGGGFGGALYVAAGQVVLTTSTVKNNGVAGGGNGGDAAYGGGVCVAGGTVTLSNDTLQSNFVNADLAFGGGLYVTGGTVTLSSDSVELNSAYDGGGLYVAGGTVNLVNDTVTANAAGYAGGGIYIASGAAVSIDAFTLAHVIKNTAAIDPNIDGTYIKR